MVTRDVLSREELFRKMGGAWRSVSRILQSFVAWLSLSARDTRILDDHHRVYIRACRVVSNGLREARVAPKRPNVANVVVDASQRSLKSGKTVETNASDKKRLSKLLVVTEIHCERRGSARHKYNEDMYTNGRLPMALRECAYAVLILQTGADQCKRRTAVVRAAKSMQVAIDAARYAVKADESAFFFITSDTCL